MLLLFFWIDCLLGCALGALLQKRFGLVTVKEKRVEVPIERLTPHPDHIVARLTSLGQYRHKIEEHAGTFEKCADYQCRGTFHLLSFLQSEWARLGEPLEEGTFGLVEAYNFEDAPPPSITDILKAEPPEALPEERRRTHAST